MGFLHLASLFLVVSLCSGEQNCSNVLNSLHGLRSHLGVPRHYADFAETYYGDQIPWKKFDDFRFTSYTHTKCRYVSRNNYDCKNDTIKEEVIEHIDEWHKKEKHHIDLRRDKNNTFHHWSIWRKPDSAKSLHEKEIGKASAILVLTADYVNLVLNTILRTNTTEPWCLPIYYEGKPSKDAGYYYGDGEKYCLESSLDDYIRMATFALQDTVKHDESLNAFKFGAGCLFDFELASDLTFRNYLVKGLKKDEVLNYVDRIWKAVQVLSNSPELEPGLVKLVKAAHDRLRDVDWNMLSTKVYAMIINGRSRALEVDVEGLFQALHEFDYAFQKGIWMYYTGQWPAMEKFVNNLVETIKTDRFWDRLDQHYVDILNQFKDTYEKRKDRLDNYIDLLRSAIKALIEKVEYISNAVDETAVNYQNKINQLEIEEMLNKIVGGPAKVVTKHFLACYTRFHGKPDFNVVVEEMVDVDKKLPKALHDLVFYNWPTEEIVPEGLDKFIETFVSSFWMLTSAFLGPCPN